MFRTRSTAPVFTFALLLTAFAVPTLSPSLALADAPPAGAEAPRTTFTGIFQRYLLMPGGRTMGLMLSDGTFVFTPGRALKRDAPALTTGTKLEIDGVALKTPTGMIVRHAIVKLDGAVIADASKAHRHHHGEGKGSEHHGKRALQAVTGVGQIAAIVSSPSGRVQALVLTDGTTVVARGIEGFGLKIGDRIAVAGQGGVYTRGKSLRVEKITLPNGQTRDVPKPAPREREPGQGPA
jgi:hypothetical protein